MAGGCCRLENPCWPQRGSTSHHPPVRQQEEVAQRSRNAQTQNPEMEAVDKFLLELTHGPRLTSLGGAGVCPSLLARVSELVDRPQGSQEKQTSPGPWQEACVGEKG